MKIIVLRNNLKNGLSSVERSVSENNTLPILKNVLVKTYNNRIKLVSTNLELGISSLVSGKIIEEGGICIPFNTFYGIINNIDSEKVELETDQNTLLIKTDNYKAIIQGINSEEFPIIPKLENTDYFLEINGELFKNSLSKIIPCVQLSEIRPEIGGVLFDFQNTILKLVGTDSFRLAEKTLNNNQFTTNLNKGFKIIVPLKTTQEIVRIFSNDKPIIIHIDSNQISFKNEDIELISRLIDGDYPDYDQIIPKEIDTEHQIDKSYIYNAIKLVSNFSGKVNDIKIKLTENKKSIEVYSANQYLGENNYLIPAKIKGKDFKEVSFNWRYILDGLRVIESPDLIFGLNGDTRPAVIRPANDASYFYILMPIKNN